MFCRQCWGSLPIKCPCPPPPPPVLGAVFSSGSWEKFSYSPPLSVCPYPFLFSAPIDLVSKMAKGSIYLSEVLFLMITQSVQERFSAKKLMEPPPGFCI